MKLAKKSNVLLLSCVRWRFRMFFFFFVKRTLFFFISPLSPCFYSLSSLSSRRSIRHTFSFSAEEEERKKTEKKKKRKEYSSESASERKENTAGFDSQRKRCACLPLGELSMRVRSQCAWHHFSFSLYFASTLVPLILCELFTANK